MLPAPTRVREIAPATPGAEQVGYGPVTRRAADLPETGPVGPGPITLGR